MALLLLGCTESDHSSIVYNSSCITNTSIAEIRGGSLSGIVEPGTDVRILDGYHDCNDLVRDDLVIYRFSGNDAPLIKMVKAIPGDTWSMDGCGIIVNNETLTTSDGTPYCIPDTRRLALYTEDYPIIPSDTYLLLGNNPDGTLDSSVFGLVSGQDIIGRAIPQSVRP